MGRDIIRLAGVTIGVPDPTATATFLETALELCRRSEDGREHLTSDGDYGLGPPPSLLTLEPHDALQLSQVRFEVAEGRDPGTLRDRLERAGVRIEDDGAGGIAFADPDGLRVVCGPRRPPLDAALPPSTVRPRRLGHVNIKVPDAPSSARFYGDAVGLALSEQVGELLYFFRAGSDHHSLGIRGNAERVNVHHLALEVPGWEYYRAFCDRLAALGHTVEYGPGRHGPGNNLFVYVLDPSSGLRVELFADMAHIDDDEAYEPPRWESQDRARTMNRWGPAPPVSFLG